MIPGYDKRTRVNDASPFWVGKYDSNAAMYAGRQFRSQEQVVSFRNNVTGTPIRAEDVDIYRGFFKQNSNAMADYLNPGPRLLASLEASGLAEKSDYQSLNGQGLDNGHPFTSTRTSVRSSMQGTGYNFYPTNFVHNSGNLHVGGPIYHANQRLTTSGVAKLPFRFQNPNGTVSAVFTPDSILVPKDADDLPSYGTRAIGLCAPSLPHASLTAVLGELALGLPALPGYSLIRSGAFGSAGDEYLNLVFGVIPTISDAKKMARVLKDMSHSLYQLRRDVGKRVRRSFVFPEMRQVDILGPSDLGLSVCAVGNSGSFGFRTVSTMPGSSSAGIVTPPENGREMFVLQSREIWFKGSFTYFLPEIPGFSGRLEKYLSEADRLLGLQMDSKVAWQLTPWSWLIDWFTDIRENIAAVQVAHSDNLVMNYGYVMERSERTAIMKAQFGARPGETYSGKQLNTEISTVTKRRLRANPYGFVSGSDNTVWTPYRLAVLAALGISRT